MKIKEIVGFPMLLGFTILNFFQKLRIYHPIIEFIVGLGVGILIILFALGEEQRRKLNGTQ